VASGQLAGSRDQAIAELEDLRHMYAHNFAGHADPLYFGRPRHVLAAGVTKQLSSGMFFDGSNVSMTASHLRFYAEHCRDILSSFR
jgi:hypothetical protein